MADLVHIERRRRPDRAALVVAGALAVLSVVVFWNTTTLGGAGSYARIGPTAFPYAIAGCLMLLAVGTVVKAWKGTFPEREPDEPVPILWIVGGLAFQMLTIGFAGFSIATGVLFAATAKGFGRGPLVLTVPLGIVIAFAIWLIFAKVLQLTLPAGPLERLAG